MEKSELVFVPSPGVGHLISTVELAKHFHEKQQFSITILLIHLKRPSLQSKTTSYIQSMAASHPDIRFVNLPFVDLPASEDQNPITFVSLIMEKQKPQVKEAIKTLSSSSSSFSSSSSTPVAALIIDLFATTMIDVGVELSIPTYIYYTSGLGSLGFMLHLPTLDVKIPCEYKDYRGEVEVPSMSPFPVFALPHPMMNKKVDEYTWYVYHGRRFREVKGLIVNTFAELEPKALQAIVDGECLPDHHPTPPLYMVGPVLAFEEESQEPQTRQLMKWLDQQPPSSVVFLCFGSLGTFSVEQLKEMALGLEHSGYHFLWSFRCRSSTDTDLDKILPDGFLDRTKDWGLVVQSWVPQVAILGHVAVGGFVSHCGWNSTLESIWFGVPILAWPLYAEQKLNAFQLVRDCGLAVELSLDYEKDGWVSAEELEKRVRCLMGETEEGQKVRKRVEEMAEASKKAVEGGGASFSALELLSNKFMIVDGQCLPDHHSTPPVYPVGPMLSLGQESQEPQTSQLMEWLDQQRPSSVVFLCFGSRGAFSVPQLKEMALGLERSGHRFLWSLRCHSLTDPDLKEILPDGFLDRTKGQGLVFQSWAPQVAILGHVAVGGFVSHCGWNSILESIWFGVPILAWPLYAEQQLNAFQLVRDYGLAVGLSMDYEKDEWVSAEEVEKGVRSLMGESKEGQKVRKRVEEMEETSKKAVGGGGSSFTALELLSNKLMTV